VSGKLARLSCGGRFIGTTSRLRHQLRTYD
jgi:hypothetical protein